MAQLNVINGIVQGQYGESVILQVVDSNGNSIDISGYITSKKVTIQDKSGLKALTYDAIFSDDGTDGKIYFVPEDGDIDRPGEWTGQIELKSPTSVRYTSLFTMDIEKRLVPVAV